MRPIGAPVFIAGPPFRDPVAPPPENERKLPANLDLLVRRALTGGGVDGIRRVLSESPPSSNTSASPPASALPSTISPAPPASAPSPTISPAPPASALPPIIFPDAPPAPPASPPSSNTSAAPPASALPPFIFPDASPVNPDDPVNGPDNTPADAPPTSENPTSAGLPVLLRQLVAAAEAASTCSYPHLPEALEEVELELARIRQEIIILKTGVSATLPSIRLPYLLLVAPADAATYMRCLQLDAVTARTLVTPPIPRIALRAQRKEELEQRLRPGLHTKIIAREELLTVPVYVVVGAVDAEHWKLSNRPLWEDPPEPGTAPYELVAAWEPVLRVVQGEVEVLERKGAGEGGRWERKRIGTVSSGRQSRVRVLDLHTPFAILRLVEGVTVWEGIPGAESGSARRSAKGLVENLEQKGVKIIPTRVCAATVWIEEGGRESGGGWPAWEEHSRVCWILSQPGESA